MFNYEVAFSGRRSFTATPLPQEVVTRWCFQEQDNDLCHLWFTPDESHDRRLFSRKEKYSVVLHALCSCIIQGRFTEGLGENVNRKRSFMNILRHIEVGVRRVGIKKDSICLN